MHSCFKFFSFAHLTCIDSEKSSLCSLATLFAKLDTETMLDMNTFSSQNDERMSFILCLKSCLLSISYF